MDEFKARQLTQMRFAIADFREEKISLNMLLSRLEGAARAAGLEHERINADLLEERRALTPSEQMQVETLIARLESQLSQVD